MIPISHAIELAVSLTSPVIIITEIPASLHLLIAGATSFLGGSLTATTPKKIGSASNLAYPSVFYNKAWA